MRNPFWGAGLTALMLCACVLTSCDRSKEPVGLSDEEIAALVAEERRAEEEERRLASEERVRANIEKLRQEELAREKAKEVQAQAETSQIMEIDWEAVEAKMAARLVLVGEELGTLRTGVGVFQEVVVKDANSRGLTLVHADGELEMAYGDLPASLQAKILYDTEEALASAAGKTLPELPESRLRAVRDRLAAERSEREAAAGGGVAQANEDTGEATAGDHGEGNGDEGSLLERRRQLAQELNDQAHRLSKLREAGYRDQHASVREQRAVIQQLERALAEAERAVMEERRRRLRDS